MGGTWKLGTSLSGDLAEAEPSALQTGGTILLVEMCAVGRLTGHGEELCQALEGQLCPGQDLMSDLEPVPGVGGHPVAAWTLLKCCSSCPLLSNSPKLPF